MKQWLKGLPPIVPALLLQGFALLAIWVLGGAAAGRAPPMLLAVLAGVLAAALTAWLGLERWWLPIQLLCAPAALLLLGVRISGWVYGGAFLLLALVYWSTFRTRVPLYLSGPPVWQALIELLPPRHAAPRFTMIDLGSGLGGVLLALAPARPDGVFYGVELAPLPVLISRLRVAWRRQGNCHIQWASYWTRDLADYDVVFAFLSPVPMRELWAKARREMRPGSLFISSSFEVPGERAQRCIPLHDRRGGALHVWTM